MKIDRESLRQLACTIVATRPEELSCDEWLCRVGCLLELKAAGKPVPAELEPVMQHIEVCPPCAEEFDLLLASMKVK